MATCSNCNGSGQVVKGGDGAGPWSDKELVECPLCSGSGVV